MTPNELLQQLPTFLMSLITTVIAYGFLPFTLSQLRKKPITKKKYMVLCYSINAIIMLVFGVLNDGSMSGGPYLLWTSIFVWRGVNTLENRYILSEPLEEIESIETPKDTEISLARWRCKLLKCLSDPYQSVCLICGTRTTVRKYKIKNDVGTREIPICEDCIRKFRENNPELSDPFENVNHSPSVSSSSVYVPAKETPAIAPTVSKTYDEPVYHVRPVTHVKPKKQHSVLVGILITVCIVLSVLLVAQFANVSQLQDQITSLEEDMAELNSTTHQQNSQIQNLKTRVKDLTTALEDKNKRINTYYSLVRSNSDQIEFVNKYVAFIENDGTNLYHKYSCPKFKQESFYIYNLAAAESNGYKPCRSCWVVGSND